MAPKWRELPFSTNVRFRPDADGARGEARPRPGATAPESGPPQSRPPSYGNIRRRRGLGRDRPWRWLWEGYGEGKAMREGCAVLAHGQAGLPKATPTGTGRKAGYAAAGWKAMDLGMEGGRYLHPTKVIFFPTPERSAGQRGFRRKGRPR